MEVSYWRIGIICYSTVVLFTKVQICYKKPKPYESEAYEAEELKLYEAAGEVSR